MRLFLKHLRNHSLYISYKSTYNVYMYTNYPLVLYERPHNYHWSIRACFIQLIRRQEIRM